MQIVFQRAWLIAVVPLNCLDICGFIFHIMKVLELAFNLIDLTLTQASGSALENVHISLTNTGETVLNCRDTFTAYQYISTSKDTVLVH